MTEAEIKAEENRVRLFGWVDVHRDGAAFECRKDLAAWRGGVFPRCRLQVEGCAGCDFVEWFVLGSTGIGDATVGRLAWGRAPDEEQAKICAGTALETWLVAVQAALWHDS